MTIDIVFTKKELCESSGLGLGKKKGAADGKHTNPPLDGHKVESIKGNYPWCSDDPLDHPETRL